MNDNNTSINYPGPEKTGAFIKMLRISHNLTQEELGDMIYVTRKAVSKWENGICYPSIDLIPRIANLFGVSLEEILSGEFKCDSDEANNTFDYVIRVFKNKRIKNTIRSIIILLIVCLLIFFFENYNATKIYDVFYEDDGLYVKNGIIISTRSKIYINFGTVWIDDKEIQGDSSVNVELYRQIDENTKKTIATYSMNNQAYFRNSNYKELTDVNMETLKDELMLRVKYVSNDEIEQEKIVPLNIELRYKSNDINQFEQQRNKLFKDNYRPEFPYKLKTCDKGKYFNNLSTSIELFGLFNMIEEDRIRLLNRREKNYNIEYSNNFLTISDGNFLFKLDMNTKVFSIRNIQALNVHIFTGKVINHELKIDVLFSEQKETLKFINLLIDIFSSFN